MNSNVPNWNPAFQPFPRSTPFDRLANARRIRKLPRRNAANSSTSFTAGSARIMPFMSSATTMASGNGLRRSGRNWAWPRQGRRAAPTGHRSAMSLPIHIGTLARGFLCEEAKFVVVTDAEIFGRYKIQRPRRLKSPHALATRSALDIDFTELEEGDLVVHLQYGIGKFLGLKNLPAGNSRHPSTLNPQRSTSTECLKYVGHLKQRGSSSYFRSSARRTWQITPWLHKD